MINAYLPFASKVLSVYKHTDLEYTFRMSYDGTVKPGQFFEVSIPKLGEAPISVSGYGEGFIELTIRRVGKVTNEIFEHYEGDTLFIRGPYGNGFDINEYKGKELIVVAGGTGLSPVRSVVDYFASHPDEVISLTLMAGFKTPRDILFKEDISRYQKTSKVIVTVDHLNDNDSKTDLVCQQGLVTEHLPSLNLNDVQTAAAIVVGPPAMMHFTCLGLLKLGFSEENIFISHERRMCCGFGKCGHCKINDVYVCTDGPVFRYIKGKTLID